MSGLKTSSAAESSVSYQSVLEEPHQEEERTSFGTAVSSQVSERYNAFHAAASHSASNCTVIADEYDGSLSDDAVENELEAE
jgi:hypothetical protein